MAPRPASKQPQLASASDGAKPGTEVLVAPNRHYGFDADGRAKTREDACITIGDIVFHRRRKNWEVTRELRTLLRLQERAGSRSERLRARISALTTEIRGIQDTETAEWTRLPLDDEERIHEIEAQVDKLDGEVDAADTESDQAAYELIALLLRTDDGTQPDVGHLKEYLDVEEAGDLAGLLAGGGEAPEGPTQTTAS
jgi:hypothetical protein